MIIRKGLKATAKSYNESKIIKNYNSKTHLTGHFSYNFLNAEQAGRYKIPAGRLDVPLVIAYVMRSDHACEHSIKSYIICNELRRISKAH